ncbi:MAG TPA: hypothetical protein VGH55_01240 [Chthoniobacterales bacterium]|jgi:hypothetical protein
MNGISSGGATSNREQLYMPLLAELLTFYVTVAIKISLLRSWVDYRETDSAPESRTIFVAARGYDF